MIDWLTDWLTDWLAKVSGQKFSIFQDIWQNLLFSSWNKALNFMRKRHLLNQNQQGKYQNYVWNLFKVNIKDTGTTTLKTSFWHQYLLWTDFAHHLDVSIVDYVQVNAGWVNMHLALPEISENDLLYLLYLIYSNQEYMRRFTSFHIPTVMKITWN